MNAAPNHFTVRSDAFFSPDRNGRALTRTASLWPTRFARLESCRTS